MTLEQWTPIAAWLGALYPNFPGDKATIAAYLIVLAEQDVRDVETGCRFLAAQPGRQFFPAVGEILAQSQTERGSRLERERLPDVTGIAQLPEAERLELLEKGLEASYSGSAPDPDPLRELGS